MVIGLTQAKYYVRGNHKTTVFFPRAYKTMSVHMSKYLHMQVLKIETGIALSRDAHT